MQIGVGLESVTRATRDADLVALATMEPSVPAAFLAPIVVSERPVIAHAQCRVPTASPIGHHDDVAGIDDAQCLAAFQRTRFYLQFGSVITAALQIHDNIAARSGFNAQLANEIVDGDRIALQDVTRGLSSGGNDEECGTGNERQRA